MRPRRRRLARLRRKGRPAPNAEKKRKQRRWRFDVKIKTLINTARRFEFIYTYVGFDVPENEE